MLLALLQDLAGPISLLRHFCVVSAQYTRNAYGGPTQQKSIVTYRYVHKNAEVILLFEEVQP